MTVEPPLPLAELPPLPPPLNGREPSPAVPVYIPEPGFWTPVRMAAIAGASLALLLALFLVGRSVFADSLAERVNGDVPSTAIPRSCFVKDGRGTPVPCTEWHHYEVFATNTFEPDALYPAEIRILGGTPGCDAAFQDYVGARKGESGYDYALAVPSKEQWAAGDHTAACVLFSTDMVLPMTGPAGG